MFMQEHKVISQMVLKMSRLTNDFFADRLIDFFKTFADQSHHGKEEKVFFQRLKNKPLSQKQQALLNELMEEHKRGRELVCQLEKNKKDKEKIKILLDQMIDLYLHHIEKENVQFFPEVIKYFSDDEKNEMLLEFYEIDHRIIFEKYNRIVQEI